MKNASCPKSHFPLQIECLQLVKQSRSLHYVKRIRNKLTFCATDGTSHQVSSRAEFMAHFFTLVAQEREYLVQAPGAPLTEGWLLMGSAKLKLNPRASRNVCAQSGSAQYIWGPKYDQFSSFKSAHTNLSSAGFQLTVVLLVCQQSWLTVNGSCLFPGFAQFDQSQSCLQSCEGPWILLMCTKQLSIVYKVVFSLAVLTAPIPSALCFSMSLSSRSPGPWHGSATLQPPENKVDRVVSMYALGTGEWRLQKGFSSGGLCLLH